MWIKWHVCSLFTLVHFGCRSVELEVSDIIVPTVMVACINASLQPVWFKLWHGGSFKFTAGLGFAVRRCVCVSWLQVNLI